MTRRNGTPADSPPAVSRSGPLERGGFAPEVEAYLARRTEQFQKATSGKGLPTTWGAGKDVRPGFAPKPPSTRRRKTG